jgi:hypothetical protein
VGRFGLLHQFFHKTQQKKIRSYAPESACSKVSGSNKLTTRSSNLDSCRELFLSLADSRMVLVLAN